MKKDLYQDLTDDVIASIEAGVPVWEKAWKSSIAVPHNALTGREYNGINILITWNECAKHDYKTNGWLTYNQARKLGGNVIKGQKSTTIIHFSMQIVKDEDTGETRTFPKFTTWRVFNIDQCENLDESKLKTQADLPEDCVEIDEDSKFMSLVRANELNVEHDRHFNPCFIPSKDQILMPLYGAFNTHEDYEATGIHEAIHATKTKARLNRNMNTYAEEELVAELGSVFMCAKLGIDATHVQHESYIAYWLEGLHNDNKLLFKAAKEAQKAVNFLLKKKKGEK